MRKDPKIAIVVSDYMVKNLGKNLTIPHLCRQFGISRGCLRQAFKTVYRQTVHEHVLHQKLDKACELIKYSDLPLDIIMYRVGFTSAKVFSWKFHCKFNIAPADLMKQVRPRRH